MDSSMVISSTSLSASSPSSPNSSGFSLKNFPQEYAYLLEKYDPEMYHNTVMTLASKMSNSHLIEMAGRLVIAEVVRSAGTFKMYFNNVKHLLSQRMITFMTEHEEELSRLIDENEELNYYDHDFFSASTLTKSYLLRPIFGDSSVESPLQMYLRVALHLYLDDGMEKVKKAFYEMAHHYYTPASPTLFNAGTKKSQGSSCFLISLGDSLESILGTGVRDAGMISRAKGGLGIGLGQLRHSGIGDDGMASGVAPVARILDKLVTYVDQGGSRAGAGTAFLPIWHIDIKEFVNATNNFSQSHTLRLAHLNTSIWMNDLFFKRASQGGKWTVFCPAKAPLYGLYAEEFEDEYVRLEELAEKREKEFKEATLAHSEAKALYLKNPSDETLSANVVETLSRKRAAYRNRIDHKVYEAREILEMIVNLEIKSGFPFVMNGDSVNTKSNQANIGKVNSSNLCVRGNTYILTREYGHVQIRPLAEVGKKVHVWNGVQWSLVTPMKTSDATPFVKVVLNNGLYLECTPEHKFILVDGSRVEAATLKCGTPLEECMFPILDGDVRNDFVNAYELGFKMVEGTGCFKIDGPSSYVPLQSIPNSMFDTNIFRVWINTLRSSWTTSIKNRCEFLAGMIDANQKINYFEPENDELAHTFQLTLQTFGVSSYKKGSRVYLLPSHVKVLFNEYGVPLRVMTAEKLFKDADATEFPRLQVERVFSPSETGFVEASYCFTEPLRNKGVFGGILTGQCQEICEVSTPETVASCNLSSISLKAFAKGRFTSSSSPSGNHESLVKKMASEGAYDFVKLGEITRSVVENLDRVIETNYYPVPEKTETLNKNTRPLGVGVSGLDDATKVLDVLFDSSEGEALNKGIFACMYFNALVSSMNLSMKYGEYDAFRKGEFSLSKAIEPQTHEWNPVALAISSVTHPSRPLVTETFKGSPLSNGFFQFDLWARRAGVLKAKGELDTNIYDVKDDIPIEPTAWGQETIVLQNGDGEKVVVEPSWDSLRKAIMRYGVRNSLLLTVMPTASTAQVLRNAESTEVHASNFYTRTVRTGHFVVTNQHLVKDLEELSLWNDNTLQYLVAFGGSLKYFEKFVTDFGAKYFPGFDSLDASKISRLSWIVKKYKTMFEMSQKVILKYARQRGIYIDQSQSTNIYLSDPSIAQVSAVHSFGWKFGLKTGLYYLRQKNAAEGGTFSLSPALLDYRQKVLSAPTSVVAEVKKAVAPVVTTVVSPPSAAPACTIEMRSRGESEECEMCGS